MGGTLDEGVRRLPDDASAGQVNDNSDSLISLDLTPDVEAVDDSLAAVADENTWLTNFLLDGAEEEVATNPNEEIVVVIPEEDPTREIEEPEASAETATDPVSDPPPVPAASGNIKGKGKKK